MKFSEIKNLITDDVILLKGIPASPGYVFGPAYIYQKEKIEVYPSVSVDVESEIKNLEFAIARSKKELNKIISITREKLGEIKSAIFEAHVMILDDKYLFDSIIKNIRENSYTAEYSVHEEFSKYEAIMLKSLDSSMQDRVIEIEDIKSRLLRNLQQKRWESKLTQSSIIITHSLTPADTILLSRNDVLAYVSEVGGLTSHTAIISRSLNIPAIVGIHNVTKIVKLNDSLIVDGFNGYLIVNPNDKIKEFYQKKIENLKKRESQYKKIAHLPAQTLDGHRVILNANIEFLHEAEYIKTYGADGVGLYRSEEMFFEKGTFPNEAEQIERYLAFVERVYPEPIVIRTFDIGGDKVLPEAELERNPFLGWRGIRMMLDKKDEFLTQIKAILKCSFHRNVKIMFPMVSVLEEIIEAKKLIEIAKNELKSQNLKFDKNIQIGMMAEVPSVICCMDEFAKEVDFVSVGTNDLIQYLLAVDRGNEIISSMYQEFNPSVIRAMKMLIDGVHQCNKKISICGQMASNIYAVPLLVGLGFDELSVNIHSVLEVKRIIRNIKLSEVKILADECLKLKTEKSIKEVLEKFYKNRFGVKNNESI